LLRNVSKICFDGYTRDFNWIYALSGNDVNLILVIRCINHQDTQILPKANSFTKPLNKFIHFPAFAKQ
jgi:hypothetical protein